MTTTDSSFIAEGATGLGQRPVAVGFYAKTGQAKLFGPFKFGAFGVGQAAGVYGTDDVSQSSPAVQLWANAGVWGHPSTITASSAPPPNNRACSDFPTTASGSRAKVPGPASS